MGLAPHRHRGIRGAGLSHGSEVAQGNSEPSNSPRLDVRRRPTLRLRLRTLWIAPELDEALASGADPLVSEELTLRAQQLAEPEKRAEFARSIELIVEDAGAIGPQLVPGPTILKRGPIARNRSVLLALARRLRGQGPLQNRVKSADEHVSWRRIEGCCVLCSRPLNREEAHGRGC